MLEPIPLEIAANFALPPDIEVPFVAFSLMKSEAFWNVIANCGCERVTLHAGFVAKLEGVQLRVAGDELKFAPEGGEFKDAVGGIATLKFLVSLVAESLPT